MTKLNRLKKEAKDGCQWRGHKMSRFRRISGRVHRSFCLHCGMDVDVNIRPLPNEIDIGGRAVALNCS